MAYLFATLVAAVLTFLAFPPVDWGFLAFVAPAPFLWALRRVGLSRQALGLGILYGSVAFGLILYWIAVLGVVAWLPLTLGFAGYAGAYAVVVWWARTMRAWQWWVVAVGGWAILEFARSRWPFGGFPWGSLGYAVSSMAWPRGAAQWLGASGWSVLAVAVAAGLALAVDEPLRQGWLAGSVAVVVVFTALGALFPPAVDGAPVRVAIVQGSTPCPRVHCTGEKAAIYDAHLELTMVIPEGSVDLVVWGENSLGGEFEPFGNPDVAVALAAEARRIGAHLLVSGTRGVSDTEFANFNLLISPEGEAIGQYLKRHPVPFGEYVPFREYLDWIPQLEQVPRDMVRGDGPGVFPMEAPVGAEPVVGTRLLGTVISFEGAFARKAREAARAGAQLLSVNTNEASFGNSPASDQLIGITRVSAAENGVGVIHAAISGKSTLIGADGDVGRTTGLFERDLLLGVAEWREGGTTLYTRFGDWLQVLAMAAVVVPLAMWRPRRRQQPEFMFATSSTRDPVGRR